MLLAAALLQCLDYQVAGTLALLMRARMCVIPNRNVCLIRLLSKSIEPWPLGWSSADAAALSVLEALTRLRQLEFCDTALLPCSHLMASRAPARLRTLRIQHLRLDVRSVFRMIYVVRTPCCQ